MSLATNERLEVQIRDIKAIAEYIETAKARLKYGTPEWNALDMAEARLQGLSMFTVFGKER